MKKKYLIISKYSIWIFVLFLGLWPAEYFKQLPHGEMFVKFYSMCISIFILVLYSRNCSKICIYIAAFEIWMILNTVFHGYSPMSVLVDGTKTVAICIITEKELLKNEEKYLKSVGSFLSIYLMINLVSMVLIPEGLWTTGYTTEGRYYFLGYENNIILTVFPLIVFITYLLCKKRKIGFIHILGVVSGVVAEIMRECTTGIIMILGFMIVCFIINLKLFRPLFNKWTVSIVAVGAFIGVVFFRIQDNFSYFFENILNRDVTFTLRTYIWDIFLELIFKNPILGYGCQPREVILNKVNAASMINLKYAIHAHDFYLDVLYKGGVIGLVLWLLIVILMLESIKDNVIDKTSKVILGAFLLYLVVFIIEPYPYMLQLFYMIIILIYINGKTFGRNKFLMQELENVD